MVVDYINGTDKVMYGYVISGKFQETTDITTTLGGATKVFDTPVAPVSSPHWYAWTPYDNDTDTYGSMPQKHILGVCIVVDVSFLATLIILISGI